MRTLLTRVLEGAWAHVRQRAAAPSAGAALKSAGQSGARDQQHAGHGRPALRGGGAWRRRWAPRFIMISGACERRDAEQRAGALTRCWKAWSPR
jgi:hypothetical protein